MSGKVILNLIRERDYLIEQLYKIYKHKDWLNMPEIVKEAVIFGLDRVSICETEDNKKCGISEDDITLHCGDDEYVWGYDGDAL